MVKALSDGDLKKIAGSAEGQTLLNQMKEHLLDGNAHEDERQDAGRISAALSAPTAGEPAKTFTTDGGVPPNPDGYVAAAGTEVAEVTAQQVKDAPPGMQKDAYLGALDRHKGDAAWIQKFYQTLGTDATAKIIKDITTALPPPGDREKQLVGQSLQTLAQGGQLAQSDMDALLSKITQSEFGGVDKGSTVFLTQALSTLPNDDAGIQVKNLFAESAAKMANGNIVFNGRESDQADAKAFMAAMATHIIATTPADNQVKELDSLRTSLGQAGFSNLISQAMKFEKDFYVPSDGQAYKNFDGVGTLLKSAGSDPNASPDLRADLFDISTKALGDTGIADKYRDNVEFKEGLGAIFQKDQDRITGRYVGDNGYDIGSDGLKQLNNFFREVVFTPPLAGNAADVAKSFMTKVGAVLNDADTLSDQQFLDKYHRTKHDMAAMVGEQTGVMVNALKESLKNIKDKSEAEVRQVVDVIGAVISVGENAAGIAGPEATIGAAVIGEAIKLNLGQIGDSIAQGKYNDAVTQLKEGGVDLSRFDSFSVNDVLKNIKNREAHDSFRGAFDYAKHLFD